MGSSEIILLFLTVCSSHINVRSEDLEEDVVDKRAPGWGKRDTGASRLGYLESVLSDLSRYELNKDSDTIGADIEKRLPGWGKRSFSDEFELDKRKPGWGKRSFSFDADTLQEKRAPGWGKRSFNTDLAREELIAKRRPGWGKRNFDDASMIDKRRPGWGKRAPGWGKRSVEFSGCQSVFSEVQLLRLKLAQLKDEAEACTNAALSGQILGQ